MMLEDNAVKGVPSKLISDLENPSISPSARPITISTAVVDFAESGEITGWADALSPAFLPSTKSVIYHL